MNGNGNSNLPFRSMAPTGVFAYGCPPIDTPPFPPGLSPVPNVVPNVMAPILEWALHVCTKCNNHHRAAEPCPFCLRAELDALKSALGDNAKPVQKIAELRASLRKALGALRDISRVTGGSLEPLIADCEKALDT